MIYVLTKERNAIEDEGIYTYIESEDFIVDYFKETKPKIIGLDTETRGLDFMEHKVVMVQIGDMNNQFIIDTRYYGIEYLRDVLESNETTKVLHNAKFDYKFIRKQFNIVIRKVYDTMLADKVLNCGRDMRSSMKECSIRYLKEDIEKDTAQSFLTHRGPFNQAQIVYGAKDVTIPLRMVQVFIPLIRREDLTKILALENRAVLAFADIEYNGISLDKEKWLERAAVTKKELDILQNKLDSIIESDPMFKEFQDPCKQLDFFKEEHEISFVNVNWGSPQQVLSIFQKVDPELKSVGTPVLNTLEERPPIIRTYMKYKAYSKLYSSYGPGMLDLVSSDGKLHTSFTQILQTGRVSSKEPNMQQIPADNSFRNCFTSGDPDWVFVSSDYSSQELCVIATIAQDPVWIKALEQGKDLHSVCAALVFGSDWEDAASDDCDFYKKNQDGDPQMYKCECKEHKELRNGVKAINFGLAYGMSEFALSDRMSITVEEARDLIKTYFKTFPKIKKTLEKFGDYGKRHGYIMTMPPFKRKRFFSDHAFIDTEKHVSGSIERKSKNTPIQGSSADMTKIAMVYVREYIMENDIPVKMVMTVHDQIDTIVHKDYAEIWKAEFTGLMEKAALKIIKNGLLKAETEISPVWQK